MTENVLRFNHIENQEKMKFFSLSFLFVFLGFVLHAQTPGELSISVVTSSTGGEFAPRNIVAIWVEDDAGNFVKTLLAYADERKTHLNTWQASTNAAGSQYNTVDAVTGATRSNHGTRNSTWDGTDFTGADMPDGTYHVWMELTDKNSTGNFSSFAFAKGPGTESLTPSNEPSFASISIIWEPTISAANDVDVRQDYNVFPNPTPGKFHVLGKDIQQVEVMNIQGESILKNNDLVMDISNQPAGIYLVVLSTKQGKVVKRILKQ